MVARYIFSLKAPEDPESLVKIQDTELLSQSENEFVKTTIMNWI
jgi:hypothetical protein